MNSSHIDDAEEERYASPPEEEFITVSQVRETLGIARMTLYLWRKKGLLPTYWTGTHSIKFKKADVLELKRKLTEMRTESCLTK